MISLIACANASCLLFILSQVSRRIHEFAIFLWEVTSYCLGARKHSRFPGPIFLRKNHGAFSKWLTDLSYWWILLAAALILLGLYFVFNAFERTRKGEASASCPFCNGSGDSSVLPAYLQSQNQLACYRIRSYSKNNASSLGSIHALHLHRLSYRLSNPQEEEGKKE